MDPVITGQVDFAETETETENRNWKKLPLATAHGLHILTHWTE